MKPGSWACFVVSVACQVGCGGILGIEDFHPPTVTGSLRDITVDVVPGVSLALHRENGARIREVTTAGDGSFAIPITEGLPLEGYFEVTSPPYVPTISRLVSPVLEHADAFQDVLTTTPEGMQLLADDADTTLDATQWLVIAVVVDAGGSTVPGATVEAVDGEGLAVPKICYTRRDTQRPCSTVATLDDGRAWLVGAQQNATLTVTAEDPDGNSYAATVLTFAGAGLVLAPVRPVP